MKPSDKEKTLQRQGTIATGEDYYTLSTFRLLWIPTVSLQEYDERERREIMSHLQVKKGQNRPKFSPKEHVMPHPGRDIDSNDGFYD